MIIDVVKLASKNRMTLTKSIRETMEIEKGDILAFVYNGNHVSIVKVDEKLLMNQLLE